MSKRINIVLPEETIKVLDRVAPKGNRSRFISQAVLHYIDTRSRETLRQRLKQEALENSGRDLALAADWYPLEEEAFQLTTVRPRVGRTRKNKRL